MKGIPSANIVAGKNLQNPSLAVVKQLKRLKRCRCFTQHRLLAC